MSTRPPKAEGMQWFNSYLIAKNVKNTLEFYEKAFGFETRMTIPDKDGTIMHAEMGYKDCILMIGAESPEQNCHSAQSLKGSPVSFYLYVDDVDKFTEKAKTAGAELLSPPKDQFWGDRTSTLKCTEGLTWTFAQNVKDFDPNNVPG